MNKNKRKMLTRFTTTISTAGVFVALPKAWQRPIIQAVLLPAHAQTSVCSMADVAGTWSFLSDDVGTIIELIPDGTGTGEDNISWSLSGFDFDMSFISSLGVETYFGTLDSSCISITGTVSNPVSSKSFVGSKLNLE